MTDAPRKTIAVISWSHIPNDPRVRRQCESLSGRGHRVMAIGANAGRSYAVEWPTGGGSPANGLIGDGPPVAASVGAGKVALFAARLNALAPWISAIAPAIAGNPSIYGAKRIHRNWPHVRQLSERAKTVVADLWIANDWMVLPVAAENAAQHRVPLVYDTHEYAVEEYGERFLFRHLKRPVIAAIEAEEISKAALVSTVSGGIADALMERYALPSRPLVVRNTPKYFETEFRPTATTIRVLYHGIVAPARGLENLVDSVGSWRDDYQLFIRGPGRPDFIASIQRLAADRGVERRVHLLPAVPMTEMVAKAREFDVGVFVMDDHSMQARYVLPNKLFEYFMAGLATVVSPLPEMAQIVRQFDAGWVADSAAPADISRLLNGLSQRQIDFAKKQSLLAAKELCWENEVKTFLGKCDALLGVAAS